MDNGKKETYNSVTTTKCLQYSFETKILWDYVSFVTFCDIKFRVSIDFDSKMKFTSNVSLPQVTSHTQICLFPPFIQYSEFYIQTLFIDLQRFEQTLIRSEVRIKIAECQIK